MKNAPKLVICQDEATISAILPRFGEGAARALEEGRIFIAKKRAAASDAIRAGDEVWMYPPRAMPREPPRVLAEREGVVAAYKPPDMATVADHRGSAGSLETVIQGMLGVRGPLVATSRLDVGVSGVVLLAADEDSRRTLARAREQGRYHRHYVAIAAAAPKPDRGRWTGSIGRASDPRLRRVGGPSAHTAETAYAVTATAPKGALLAVEPQTGRTHQIRVHAAHSGCPLWGDAAYGGPTRLVSANGAVASVDRVALHAAWVDVAMTASTSWRVEAPLPPDFHEIWAGCGGDPSSFAGAWAAIYPET